MHSGCELPLFNWAEKKISFSFIPKPVQNPKWKEIEESLLPGQTANDRPDIVARVFQLRLKRLMDQLIKEGVFGEVDGYLVTIEWQKRGLPHAHILLILKRRYRLLN